MCADWVPDSLVVWDVAPNKDKRQDFSRNQEPDRQDAETQVGEAAGPHDPCLRTDERELSLVVEDLAACPYG